MQSDKSTAEDEVLFSAIATYLPDRQIITFSADMPVLPEGDTRGQFESPQVFGWFFHEWMHYVHNVSTIHGMSAFTSLIGLWNAFRFTTDESGYGRGTFSGANKETLKTQRYVEVLMATRAMADCKLPGNLPLQRYKIVDCEPIASESGPAQLLKVTLVESNAAGDTVKYSKTIGPTEVLESVAHLLESRLLARVFGCASSRVPVFPYQSLTLLSQYLAPTLVDDDILRCGLASLQSTYPADAIFQILRAAEQLQMSGGNVEDWLKNLVVSNLQSHEAAVRIGLDEVFDMFPVDQGLARAVRSTVSFMRQNLDLRLSRPFFEFDLIEEIRTSDSSQLTEAIDQMMRTHGICSCRQERSGQKTDIGRDTLFNFHIAATDDGLNESRLVMLASFDYLLRHVREDGSFRRTDELTRCCSFFTSCIEPFREEHSDVCVQQPWKAVIMQPSQLCTYALGVRHLARSSDVRDRVFES